jgi:hypothetical protein
LFSLAVSARMDAPPQKTITDIMVVLKVEDEQALFIVLAADGSINRLGTGSVTNNEHDLFIGRTSADVFTRLHQRVTPELLRWIGQYADPSPQGKICTLTVGFKHDDNSEAMSYWRYGAESRGPAPAVRDFVIAAVNATTPWFEEQKKMTRK